MEERESQLLKEIFDTPGLTRFWDEVQKWTRDLIHAAQEDQRNGTSIVTQFLEMFKIPGNLHFIIHNRLSMITKEKAKQGMCNKKNSNSQKYIQAVCKFV